MQPRHKEEGQSDLWIKISIFPLWISRNAVLIILGISFTSTIFSKIFLTSYVNHFYNLALLALVASIINY